MKHYMRKHMRKVNSRSDDDEDESFDVIKAIGSLINLFPRGDRSPTLRKFPNNLSGEKGVMKSLWTRRFCQSAF